jgi:TrwC relaxase
MADTPSALTEGTRGWRDRRGGRNCLLRGVTMSLHKLTAGSGYDYLTRQVAALDATDKGRTGLASYYIERGESPGVWMGSGMEESTVWPSATR